LIFIEIWESVWPDSRIRLFFGSFFNFKRSIVNALRILINGIRKPEHKRNSEPEKPFSEEESRSFDSHFPFSLNEALMPGAWRSPDALGHIVTSIREMRDAGLRLENRMVVGSERTAPEMLILNRRHTEHPIRS
jgi:hypothetical protein